jgi:hypothetical protein
MISIIIPCRKTIVCEMATEYNNWLASMQNYNNKQLLDSIKEVLGNPQPVMEEEVEDKNKCWRQTLFGSLLVLKLGLLVLSFTYAGVEGFDLAKEMMLKVFGADESSLLTHHTLMFATLATGLIIGTCEAISYYGFEYSLRKRSLGIAAASVHENTEFILQGIKLYAQLLEELKYVNNYLDKVDAQHKAQETAKRGKIIAYLDLLQERLDSACEVTKQSLQSKKVKCTANILIGLGGLIELGSTAYFSFGFGMLVASAIGVTGIGAVAVILAIVAPFVIAKAYQFKQLNAQETIDSVQRSYCGVSADKYAKKQEKLLDLKNNYAKDYNVNILPASTPVVRAAAVVVASQTPLPSKRLRNAV